VPQDPVQARDRRRGAPTPDLETLPREVRSAVEAMVAGREVTLRREGGDVGVLAFRPAVLEGTVVSGPQPSAAESATPEAAPEATPEAAPDGVTVVATATKTVRRRAPSALRRTGARLHRLDLLKAPSTADVVLTHPVSPQLLGSLRAGFPSARVIVTEIDDEELGVSHPGPVSRLLDAGASAYLPPRPLREVASSVHAYLTAHGAPQITAAAPATAPTAALPPPSHQAE
jgi:hypothetical protein